MAVSRELNDLFKKLIRQNWRIVQTPNGHFKCYPPDGGPFVVTGGTLSDHRAVKNIRARFRKAGALLGMPKAGCAKPILRGGKKVCPVPKKSWRRGR
jgi:hypothetical protein